MFLYNIYGSKLPIPFDGLYQIMISASTAMEQCSVRLASSSRRVEDPQAVPGQLSHVNLPYLTSPPRGVTSKVSV